MMLWILLAAVAVFVAVIAIRTAAFKPKPQPVASGEAPEFDREKAVDALAQLIRCKTVSYNDHTLEDDAEFEKLIALLPQLYPHVFETCSFDRLPDRALLLRWPGKNDASPSKNPVPASANPGRTRLKRPVNSRGK